MHSLRLSQVDAPLRRQAEACCQHHLDVSPARSAGAAVGALRQRRGSYSLDRGSCSGQAESGGLSD